VAAEGVPALPQHRNLICASRNLASLLFLLFPFLSIFVPHATLACTLSSFPIRCDRMLEARIAVLVA
jgi:hypothetical protein